jgi:predicted AlkP superfamily pyrophosphatase or phosphodiesterase
MHRTLVLNVVGLTLDLLGQDTPHLAALAQRGGVRPLSTITPAVTCSVQSTILTGLLPHDHGIVGNGWYFRDLAEVYLWRQSNSLVEGEKIWEAARRIDPSFTCAKLFWWYNMHSTADYTVTPRPIYLADGGKLPDIYTQPVGLRDELNQKLSPFPLFRFWGPAADILSSQWIADCARHVYDQHKPTLTLVYLPHLDYDLQRLGPKHPAIRQDLRQIDAVCGELIEHVEKDGTRVIVLSEYGITDVNGPVHINRILREANLLAVREELGRELLNAGASEAFAVADHQIARLCEVARSFRRSSDCLARCRESNWCSTKKESGSMGLDHVRSGELIAVSCSDRWFSYYYWLDDERAPDFARRWTFIASLAGDQVELFIDPALRLPKLRVAWRLAQKKLGFRMLMDVISLDATLPKGSHGRVTDKPEQGPLFITSESGDLPVGAVSAVDVKGLILRHVFGDQVPGMRR